MLIFLILSTKVGDKTESRTGSVYACYIFQESPNTSKVKVTISTTTNIWKYINRLDTITEGACLWITRSLPQFQSGIQNLTLRCWKWLVSSLLYNFIERTQHPIKVTASENYSETLQIISNRFCVMRCTWSEAIAKTITNILFDQWKVCSRAHCSIAVCQQNCKKLHCFSISCLIQCQLAVNIGSIKSQQIFSTLGDVFFSLLD